MKQGDIKLEKEKGQAKIDWTRLKIETLEDVNRPLSQHQTTTGPCNGLGNRGIE